MKLLLKLLLGHADPLVLTIIIQHQVLAALVLPEADDLALVLLQRGCKLACQARLCALHALAVRCMCQRQSACAACTTHAGVSCRA